MHNDPNANELVALQSEVSRLKKVVASLVARAENTSDLTDSDFGVFQATLLLEDQVRSRTQELRSALHRLETTNRALDESNALFQAIFDLMPNPVALSSMEDATLLKVSRSFADFFGYRPAEMVGKRTGSEQLKFWSDPDQRAQYRAAAEAAMGETVRFEGKALRRDGSVAQVVLTGRTINVCGKRFLMTDVRDVTEEARRGAHLRSLSEHDALTGLPNRRLFLERLNQAMTQARQNASPLAVCYLDLDGFKEVNDRLGHQAGDDVLVEAANRLVAAVRGSDTVGRLGGDEFAILLPGLPASGNFDEILRRILNTVRRPYALKAGSVDGIGASIGFTVYPDDDVPAQTLLEHADQSMYAVKRAGKNHFRRFRGNTP